MIRIGTKEEFLEIEELERIPEELSTPGDVLVRVTVRFREFMGSYSGVWISKLYLENFINNLQLVAKYQLSNSMLTSISAHDFTLEIRPIDSLGHFEIAVTLGRTDWSQYASRKTRQISLSGGFDVETNQLLGFIERVRMLIC